MDANVVAVPITICLPIGIVLGDEGSYCKRVIGVNGVIVATRVVPFITLGNCSLSFIVSLREVQVEQVDVNHVCILVEKYMDQLV